MVKCHQLFFLQVDHPKILRKDVSPAKKNIGKLVNDNMKLEPNLPTLMISNIKEESFLRQKTN